MKPKDFFDSNPDDLAQVVRVVRAGFGRELDFQDIYRHVTNPESVYLLRNGEIKAMASYSKKSFYNYPSLVVEGIAVAPEFQGKGVFKDLTDQAYTDESFICLRTQNPRMYRALEKYCLTVFLTTSIMPESMRAVRREFAEDCKNSIDENGVVIGYYGGLFYGKEPIHCSVSEFFRRDLKIDLSRGDAVLAVGIGPRASILPRDIPEGYLGAMEII